jgi:long-chain acyl-CoA synthetase
MLNDASVAMFPSLQRAQGIADLLDFRARSHGPKDALVLGDERVTYGQLHDRAHTFAGQLQSLGIVRGDRVGLFLPNCIDYVAAFFGAVGMGCIVVPINPLLKAEEITHILNDAQARALIVHEYLLPGTMQALPELPTLSSIIVVPATAAGLGNLPEHAIKIVEFEKSKSFKDAWPVQIDSAEDVAVIVYTSGTTGRPKGAVLTHNNLMSVFPARLDLLDIDEHDRCMGVLPLCHIYGMTVVMIGSVAKASTLVIVPKFDCKLILETIEHERVTLLPAVPAMYQFMLAELAQNSYDVSTIRICFSGAAPLPAAAIAKIEEAFGAPVIEGYALTETACAATINPLHGERKAGSVGPGLPGLEIGILDANKTLLPTGKDNVGEIAVRGPNVMLGYYKQPEATAEVLVDGWFLTGDLGYLDEAGYLYIVGRKKELIIRGGANIYPKEVEDAIMRLPGVQEVAVIGVPDPHMGERVKAVVVRASEEVTEDVIKAHCTNLLADYKVPRLVEFIPILPRNSTGKVLKRMLS